MSAFSLRKISIWAFSEDSRDRRMEMISPAVLNVASEGTVVAGADRYCLAKRARCGKRERLDPHQVSGEKSWGSSGSARYTRISCSSGFVELWTAVWIDDSKFSRLCNINIIKNIQAYCYYFSILDPVEQTRWTGPDPDPKFCPDPALSESVKHLKSQNTVINHNTFL